MVGVGEDRERQAVLLRELLVRLDVVDADAEDRRAGVAEREDVVAELAGLGRAARRLILGIEVQRDPLAAIILQLVPLAVLVLQLEVGRGSCRAPVRTVSGGAASQASRSGEQQIADTANAIHGVPSMQR